jgi:protein TonB
MKRGKQTCKILKDIRRQIAEANDIEFITSECQYQGDCLGTCPKCEAEVRYLEQQLERKRIAGKAVTVLGISAGLVAMSPMTSCTNSANKGTNQEIINDTIANECMFGDVIPITEEDTIVASIKDTPSPPPVPEVLGTCNRRRSNRRRNKSRHHRVRFSPRMDSTQNRRDAFRK